MSEQRRAGVPTFRYCTAPLGDGNADHRCMELEPCPLHALPLDLAAEVERLRAIAQRIRAGWLPHRLSAGSWWWGRPRNDDGFHLWAKGLVPSMLVVEPMEFDEIAAWFATLHAEAPERRSALSDVAPPIESDTLVPNSDVEQ